MQRHTRNLFTALVGAGALTLLASTSSFALDIPTPLNYDMGPLGTWKLNGGFDGFVAGWNHNTPSSGGAATIQPGASQLNGDVSIDNAIFILNSKGNMFENVPLQFHVWVGIPPNTPVVGYTSPNLGPNLHALQGKGSLNGIGHGSPLFKGWATYQPLDWFSIEGGRLPSPDGTEIGVDFLNPTVFLSDLNNMQTTTADGGQINFIAGGDNAFYDVFGVPLIPGYGSTLTIRIADGYKTGHANELGFTGLWNLNPDGSDFLVGFGHTRLDTVGSVSGGASKSTGFVAGFGTVNADLIGVGWSFNLPSINNGFSILGQAERQWLPKSAIPSSVRRVAGQDYYNWAIENTFVQDFGLHNAVSRFLGQPIRLTAAVQPEFIYQHGDSSDPNDNQLGNFLGLNASDSGSGSDVVDGGDLGTFGAGSKKYAIQANLDIQFHNFFFRPALTYTYLASIDRGFGYGTQGQEHSQVVGLLEFGFLLGQQEDTDTGQH